MKGCREILEKIAMVCVLVFTMPSWAQEIPEETCRPDCREGFVCVDGACVSACNPPCASGEVCTAQATCVPSKPATPAPEAPTRPGAEAPRSGNTFLAGIGFLYLRPFHLATTSGGDEYAAHAGGGSIQGVFAVDFGLLGLRFSGGAITNSDSSAALNAYFSLGPTLTFKLGQHVFVGVDLSLDVSGYTLSHADFVGADTFSPQGEHTNELDVDFQAALAAGLRLGGIIPVGSGISVVPELRAHGSFLSFVAEDPEVDHVNGDGCCAKDPVDAIYVPGVTVSISGAWQF